MPELAEVEYYRRQWDAGLRRKIVRVALHPKARLFRGEDTGRFVELLVGAQLLGSEARAKQMLFRFSRGLWIGVHLGMTGKIHVAPRDFSPGRHDHLVLFQPTQTLVFNDPRMFGRVRFHEDAAPPSWWSSLPPAVSSPEFTEELVREFLRRRTRLAVKAALMVQERFPGVGNWMADEILWRARIDPRRTCGTLGRRAGLLWRETREVCRVAMETVAVDFSDPPADWFYHVRWRAGGECPRCGAELKTDTIGGRTTRWCGRCQR